MKTIYLSGPMTGLPEHNYPEFMRVANLIRELGHEVINPAELFEGAVDLPRTVYMKAAIQNVLNSDLVVFLDKWETSGGAQLEVEVANASGIPVVPYRLILTGVNLREVHPSLGD